jgi:cholesterol transport system auxiliary component
MLRPLVALLALLASACASQRPLPVRYDLEGDLPHAPLASRFKATLAVSAMQAPSWLHTTALVYRLDYEPAAPPRAYTLRRWTAPPSELVTFRLRERIAGANDGFTLDHLPVDTDGYRLEVTLQNFMQSFPSPGQSRCVVSLSASLFQHGDRVIAQRTFRAERPAPSPDAIGAVQGLLVATDADLDELLSWLGSSLSSPHLP